MTNSTHIRHFDTFDGQPVVGEHVTGRSWGPGYAGTFSGIYEGVRPSEWTDAPHHFLRDGEINGIPQRTMSFPVGQTVTTWWNTARDTCPACGSDDVSAWGDTGERTDADLTDHAECNACGWGISRTTAETDAEADAEANAT
jgi:hypothetical protein